MTDEDIRKDRFTSLDTLALVRELRGLGRAHIDKVFDAGPSAWTILLRAPGLGKSELHLVAGRFGALLREGAPRREGLTPLASTLRRWLSGGRIASVAEPGGERLLRIELTRGDVPEPLALVVEFFGRGNLVLTRGERILAVAESRRWAHREVRPGATYVPPPSRQDPWIASIAELTAALMRSTTDRASTLAARLALGGPVAEELLARAHLPGRLPASQDPGGAAARLRLAMDELLGEIGETPMGSLYHRSGGLIDVEPFSARRFLSDTTVTEERLPRFSDAAERYFKEMLTLDVESPPAVDPRAGELQRQIAQQESAAAALAADWQRNRSLADHLLAHTAVAEQLLAALPSGARRGDTVSLIVEGTEVPLVAGESIRGSAQRLYELAKRAREKLLATQEALTETRRKLAELPSLPSRQSSGREASAPATRHAGRRWFERFRWFLSSDGIVVVGGKDAATNDLVVRKYLGERDLYVHADIHGAASVIIKHPGGELGEIAEATRRQAAQWALAFSKAWRAGHAAGDAFWVTAEQVSKTAASGEFVPRGSWVIHGTKHLFHDLPLELGIGTMVLEGESLWRVAPPAAFSGEAKLRFVLVPGDERERSAQEAALARELGVPRSVLQPLLPAGGFQIRRA